MMALIGRMIISEKMAQPNFVGPSVMISNNKIEINRPIWNMILDVQIGCWSCFSMST